MVFAKSTKVFLQFCGAAALTMALAIMPSMSRAQDASLSASARRERIHGLLLSLLDTQRVALFMLGSAQSTASPDAVAAYTAACRDFMVANYDSKLGNYAGQTLRVTGATQ